MMGSSHALSGAALWTAGCALSAAAGARPGPAFILVGGVLCAGAALLPDGDCPGDLADPHGGSHAARAFGGLSRGVAYGVAALSLRVQHATRTRADMVARQGHRWLTHTGVFALALGAAVSGLALTPAAGWIAGATLFLCATLAARALLPWQMRGFRLAGSRWPAAPLWGVVFAAGTWALAGPSPSWVWLGAPVAAGCVIHDWGDIITDGGAPFFWPVPIGGQRWHRVELALFRTNSAGEQLAALAFLVCLAGSAASLAGGF